MREEDNTRLGILDFDTPEDADAAMAEEVSVDGVTLEKELLKKHEMRPRVGGERLKLYIGNLPMDVDEEFFKSTLQKETTPKSVFVAKSSKKEKKYAFLEFEDERERNLALGKIEELKKDGKLDADITASPAYPAGNAASRRKGSPRFSKPNGKASFD